MRYCVLYPKTENVHLTKDVGMIAYKLNKIYKYDSYVVTYKNGEYPYIKSDVEGLKLDFIERKHNNIIDIYNYFKHNAHKIDVLQIFHMTFNSVLYAFIFKFFNKKGIIYLKLDCTSVLLNKIKSLNKVKRIFLNLFLNKIDILGVEQKKIFNDLREELEEHKNKLLNTTNGIDFENEVFKQKIDYDLKQNVILSVGRIGSPEKNSKVLMDAFAGIDRRILADWKLVFIGPIEEEFKSDIKSFFELNSDLKDKIIFKGPIYDRKVLYNEYKKAKIFCMTSEFESFGIVLIEAGVFGDVIVSTRVGVADEIITSENGELVDSGDVLQLTKAIVKLITDKKLLEKGHFTEKFCRKNYDWDAIVNKIYCKIKKLKENGKYD